jgi:2,4-dienoyl-CoA reductase (NADPH2)
VDDGHAHLEDVWTGQTRRIPCATVVDCGHRLPDETLYLARPGTLRAGDAVAPRGILESVLEGRRRALDIAGGTTSDRLATAGATAGVAS